MAKLTVNDIINYKNKEKLTCLTAYTYPIAKIVDQYCEMILVGDSLGMCVYGFKDTIDVSVGMMIDHGRAVCQAAQRALVIVDIPCNSFEESPQQALATAQQIYNQTGCDALKIETSPYTIESIKLIAQNNIPIMAHVGLLPQKVRELGGYKYQGRTPSDAQLILQTAIAAQQAGAFSIVIEAVPARLANAITSSLKIPTIGIGASAACDGQVLVIDDLLGLNQEFKPKFVKNYANLAALSSQAVAEFVKEVKQQKFPAKENIVD